MSYRTPRPTPAPDMKVEGVEEAWLSWIEGTYGVVLGDGQLYADNRGQVFAASEYVATLGRTKEGAWQLAPEYAHGWSEQLAHRPRHTGTTELSYRKAPEPDSELAELLQPISEEQFAGMLERGEIASEEVSEAELAYYAELESRCEAGFYTGGFDPYATSCKLEAGHKGPHQGNDPFGNSGVVEWEGGGSAGGDPLPYQNVKYRTVEEEQARELEVPDELAATWSDGLPGPEMVEQLRELTTPLPGRDGWRQSEDGRVWFSSAWLGLLV